MIEEVVGNDDPGYVAAVKKPRLLPDSGSFFEQLLHGPYTHVRESYALPFQYPALL